MGGLGTEGPQAASEASRAKLPENSTEVLIRPHVGLHGSGIIVVGAR
ncbi:hypothetical protein [Sorangium sp. So ce1153]